jgi:O-antigen ligase
VYANPNDLAAIALLVLSIAAGLAVTERDRRYRLAAFGVSAFVAFDIFITQSRGALIALAVFVIAVLWRAPKRQRARATAAVALIAAVVVAFAPASVWDRLSGLRNVTSDDLSQVDAEGSATQRFEIWKVARTIIAENPVTGVGVNAYPLEHSRVAPRAQFLPTARGKRDTHSTYLNVAAETGFPGLVLFSMVVIVTIGYAERVRRGAVRRDPDMAQQLFFLELGLIVYLTAGLWGSFAKLNMLYLHLVLIWCTAKMLEGEGAAARAHAPPQPAR